MKISRSHDSSHGFGWLTQVDSSGFFMFFVNCFFFTILIFNIELIEN